MDDGSLRRGDNPRRARRVPGLAAGAVHLVTLLAAMTFASTPTSGDGVGRDRLRFIVQEECVPHWLQAHDPAPCVRVVLAGHDPADAAGFAVLHDRKGGAHFLLIPTRVIRGVESPEARAPDAPNYFEDAWEARDLLAGEIGHTVPRAAVGMAVNQLRARSQDQLHIHLSCLKASIHEALAQQADGIGQSWTPIRIGPWQYQAMRVMGETLGSTNPFEILADRLAGARGAMNEFTLLVAAADFRQGPGFILLAGMSVPGAELMLDSSCALGG